MATVRWINSNGKETLKHEEGFFKTLCGLDIPRHSKEWNAYGEAECKRCLKAKERLNQE
ncbi:MAG: hypothetical protein HRU24_00040 [Gammaproteobacteria bacterium]|nr:hypothetical protein [Gammaproteobacteria bacterium]